MKTTTTTMRPTCQRLLKKKLMNHKRWKSIRDSNAGKSSQENETKAGGKHHRISEPVEEEEEEDELE
ncbi:unnamed protein product [Sphagnum jensenii]|uniref:Uncharacterized protein n=1 Tax=Sphagnum jensenii TaxID=128206 RepID=A0ABP1C1N3_9BRYO